MPDPPKTTDSSNPSFGKDVHQSGHACLIDVMVILPDDQR